MALAPPTYATRVEQPRERAAAVQQASGPGLAGTAGPRHGGFGAPPVFSSTASWIWSASRTTASALLMNSASHTPTEEPSLDVRVTTTPEQSSVRQQVGDYLAGTYP